MGSFSICRRPQRSIISRFKKKLSYHRDSACWAVCLQWLLAAVLYTSRLWSADHDDIVLPLAQSTRFGRRSFRVCGPTIWNKLPQDLRSTDTNVVLRAGYLSVRTVGDASDRHWLKARLINGLTYLLTYRWATLAVGGHGSVTRSPCNKQCALKYTDWQKLNWSFENL